MVREIVAVLVALCLCSTPVYPRTDQDTENVKRQLHDFPFRTVSLSWEERVEDLVSRLTLEEMQVQMARGGTGDIGGPAPAISRLGIGPYVWNTECLRGDTWAVATAFPQSLGLAATFSPNLMYRMAEATGVEVRGRHNDLVKQGNYGGYTGASCFAPVVNIMRDPRWGRNQETYGEDPYLSGVMGASYTRGLQGNHSRYVRASGGCKHFDVHGGPENIPVSRFGFDAIVSETDWRMTYLPAFRACVEAGTYSLMCSFNKINGVPACANKKLLTDVLRNEWNFTGYVVSDQGGIELVLNLNHYYIDSVHAAAGMVDAGVSLELTGNDPNPVFFSLAQAVHQRLITEQKVREMVTPLFYTRMRLGEFDPPEMNPYSSLSSANVSTDKHKALAEEAALQSFVLLKNNGVLPLTSLSSFHTIAIVGPMVDTTKDVMGDYAAIPPYGSQLTVLQGLRRHFTGTVQFSAGCDNPVCKNYDRNSVLKAIGNSNIVFVVLGTGETVEMEDKDRPDMELPGQQGALLSDVINNTPATTPIVLILMNTGPVNISFADSDPRVSAILECFLPAQATGTAVWRALLNEGHGAVPAGRLPYTWPLLASQVPDMVNYSMEGRTYRYFKGDPLYPFGYGLSYSKFLYSDLSVPTSINAGTSLVGQVKVSNVDQLAADEVVQVYIQWRNQSLHAPKLQLVFFDRFPLAAGQRDLVVAFEIEAKQMAMWTDNAWVVSAGIITIYAGGQQPLQSRAVPSNILSANIEIVGSKRLGRF